MKKLTKKQKEHIMSAVHTFATAFIITVAPSISDLNWQNVDQALILGILAAGMRAGIKSVITYFFPKTTQ